MTNTPNQTLVNEFDELTALARKDYEAATVEFEAIVAKAKTLYGAARAAHQMENKPKCDELQAYINVYEKKIIPAHDAVKTAAAQGDLETLEKEGEKLVDGLEALAELSPDLAERFRSLESGVTSLKKNDPVQDARLDHIEKHLLQAGGYVPYGTTPTKEMPVVPTVPQAPASVASDAQDLADMTGAKFEEPKQKPGVLNWFREKFHNFPRPAQYLKHKTVVNDGTH